MSVTSHHPKEWPHRGSQSGVEIQGALPWVDWSEAEMALTHSKDYRKRRAAQGTPV